MTISYNQQLTVTKIIFCLPLWHAAFAFASFLTGTFSQTPPPSPCLLSSAAIDSERPSGKCFAPHIQINKFGSKLASRRPSMLFQKMFNVSFCPHQPELLFPTETTAPEVSNICLIDAVWSSLKAHNMTEPAGDKAGSGVRQLTNQSRPGILKEDTLH